MHLIFLWSRETLTSRPLGDFVVSQSLETTNPLPLTVIAWQVFRLPRARPDIFLGQIEKERREEGGSRSRRFLDFSVKLVFSLQRGGFLFLRRRNPRAERWIAKARVKLEYWKDRYSCFIFLWVRRLEIADQKFLLKRSRIVCRTFPLFTYCTVNNATLELTLWNYTKFQFCFCHNSLFRVKRSWSFMV